MKKVIWAIVIIVVLVLLVGLRLKRREVVVQREQGSIPVEVEIAKRMDMENWVWFSGVVQGIDQTPIFPDLPGRFLRYVVKEGSYVKKGDVVAYLEREVPGVKIKPVPVKAPITGIVSINSLDKGFPVMQNTPVATVARINRVKVSFQIPSGLRLKKNDPVYLVTSDGKKIYGRITFISYFVDPKTGTRRVITEFENKNRKVLPGDFVRVYVRNLNVKNVVALPVNAVLGVEEKFVFLVKNGKAFQTSVKTGAMNNSFIQILEGVTEGDTVIVVGQEIVRDGSRVEIRGIND